MPSRSSRSRPGLSDLAQRTDRLRFSRNGHAGTLTTRAIGPVERVADLAASRALRPVVAERSVRRRRRRTSVDRGRTRSRPRSRGRGRCRTSPGRRSRSSSARRRRRAAAAGGRRATRPRPCGGSRAGRRRGRCRGRRARARAPGPPRRGCRGAAGRRRRLSSAPRTDAAPATSPACGTEPRPSDFACVNTASYGSGGYSASSPPSPTPTTPRSRVARAPLDGRARLLLREPARDVGRQPDLDAVQLLRLLRAVADALEDVLPGAAAAHALGRAEDPLEVDGAVRRGLGRVVDDHLAEVRLRLQRVRREDPDLDEVAEVGELVELLRVPRPCRRAARSRSGARSRAASARARCPRDARAARSSGRARTRPRLQSASWARHRTGCARSAARCSATGSPSASAAARAGAGSSSTRTRCPTTCAAVRRRAAAPLPVVRRAVLVDRGRRLRGVRRAAAPGRALRLADPPREEAAARRGRSRRGSPGTTGPFRICEKRITVTTSSSVTSRL